MAFSTGGSGTGSRSTPTTLAEINVTPLVDVMLVLLIVFMISAPMMQQGLQVDLPKANAGSLNDAPEQLILVVNKLHDIRINGNSVEPSSLRERIAAIVAVKPALEVFIQADRAVPYGYVAQVMAEVKQAKVTRVGLVTEPGDLDPKL